MSTYSRLADHATGALSQRGITRAGDNAFIPADPLNSDWRAYQDWLKAGNKPAEADETAAASGMEKARA